MKYTFTTLLLACSLLTKAQVVSGLYAGTLVNDSTRKEQRYELALSEYRGKITGYAYTTFVVNDTFYYSIKRVKGFRTSTEILIEDERMIAHNSPTAAAKGVRQVNHIALTNEDTLRTVSGWWETTRTKIYYSLRGASAMKQQSDSNRSPLISHLKELGIISQPVYAKTPAAGKQAPPPAALPYMQRQSKLLQTIEISGDSLQLSVYDNGVVDGDTISLYCNGVAVMEARRLQATALKKTIALPATESTELLLVAENLGSIPPNTGLLVIRDGTQTHSLNFSADLQTNARIILKRKKR